MNATTRLASARQLVVIAGLAIAVLITAAFARLSATAGSSRIGVALDGYDYSSVSGQPTVGAPGEEQLTVSGGRHKGEYLEQQLYQVQEPRVNTTVQHSR
jgi:hypothetical protein